MSEPFEVSLCEILFGIDEYLKLKRVLVSLGLLVVLYHTHAEWLDLLYQITVTQHTGVLYIISRLPIGTCKQNSVNSSAHM